MALSVNLRQGPATTVRSNQLGAAIVTSNRVTKPRVLIIGAGIAGLCMGEALERARVPFAIFEKAGDLGGTWRENVYPGSGCDVPSHLYCYSFEPNPDYSRAYAAQAEIRGCLRG